MPKIVDFPSVVKEAMRVFGDLFENEPERRHLAEYLTGLMVAERKSVSGMSREFVEAADQSCLNRWLTQVEWDERKLNDRRLEWLQEDKQTRYHRRGVIPIDNVLVDHEGKLIEEVGWLWDHADQRYVIAHDYVIANYVCPSEAHYPLDWRRFRKRADCPPEEFQDHTELCRQLVEEVIRWEIPGDFTFDCYFSSAALLNYIDGQHRNYVGDLKLNRKVLYRGQEQKLNEVARQVPAEAKRPILVGRHTYWYFSRRMRLPEVKHPVRVVFFWLERQDKEASKALGTNRVNWEVKRIHGVYRHRWTGTETFHRDGKQQLGMGDCQVRKAKGQTRHLYLVCAAYSLLMHALHATRPRQWARGLLTTIGEACQAVKAETLGQVVDWVAEQLTQEHRSVQEIKTALAVPC